MKSELKIADDTEVSFVPMDAVGELGGLRLDQTKPLEDVYNGYTYFVDGDVCVAKITPCFENGKGALAERLTNGVGFGTTELHVIRPLDQLDRKFLFYLTISHSFRNLGAAEMVGAGGQKRVPEAFIKNWRTHLPPLPTQKAIAAFLDEKTAQIDALIAKKQAILDRLAEKRQAVITQAVTKGLNPDAAMKDSGIRWLGAIPAHWQMMGIKNACEEIVDCKNRTPPNVTDGRFFVIRTSCLGGGLFDPSEGYWTDAESYAEWTKKGTPRSGDILISREAPMGEACAFPEGYELCLGQRMMLARPDPNKLVGYFLLMSIYSDLGREYVNLRSKGSTVGHLRVPEVFNFPVILPPLCEQRQIVDWLRRRIEELEQQRTLIEKSISLLIEYRRSLISFAVVGNLEEVSNDKAVNNGALILSSAFS